MDLRLEECTGNPREVAAHLTYQGLTPSELRESTYPESQLVVLFLEGLNKETSYPYTIGFVGDHPRGPYLKIDTELRRDFLKRGSEREAEDALRELAFAVRERMGGSFGIHPFYGAIFGTHFNPIATFCEGRDDESLSTIINLTDDDGNWDEDLTREAMDIGTTFVIPSRKASQFIQYLEAASKASPNQRNRDQAITNHLGPQWDAEFARYNPHLVSRAARLGNKITRLAGRGIPEAMTVTQAGVAHFMDDLRRLGFEGLRVERAMYKDIAAAEFVRSTFPRGKIKEISDEHWKPMHFHDDASQPTFCLSARERYSASVH